MSDVTPHFKVKVIDNTPDGKFWMFIFMAMRPSSPNGFHDVQCVIVRGIYLQLRVLVCSDTVDDIVDRLTTVPGAPPLPPDSRLFEGYGEIKKGSSIQFSLFIDSDSLFW